MPRLFAIATVALLFYGTDARPQDIWVTTWTGAVQPFGNCCAHYNSGPPEFRDAFEKGVLDNQTIRIVIRSTISGHRVRIRLSNKFGKDPLIVGMAHIVALPSDAMPGEGPDRNPVQTVREIMPMMPKERTQGRVHYLGDVVILGTNQEILFSGQHGVVVAPGGTAVSDPVDFETGDGGLMAVSLYLPNKIEPATWVRNAITTYVFQGDIYNVARGILVPQNRGPAFGIFWLSSVEVLTAAASKTILMSYPSGGRTAGSEYDQRRRN